MAGSIFELEDNGVTPFSSRTLMGQLIGITISKLLQQLIEHGCMAHRVLGDGGGGHILLNMRGKPQPFRAPV